MKSIMSVNLPISVIQDMKHLPNKSSFVEKAIKARLNGMTNFSIRDETSKNLVYYLLNRIENLEIETDKVTYMVLQKLYEVLE
jgi:uncharacterized protein Yka (UPF0111/DUF47 family)